jgi:hypothetical protein
MSTEILMPALSPTISLVVARLDRATQQPRVCAAQRSWIPAFAGMTMGACDVD